ncbi:hypothetical protein BUALT_Bualt03G0022900 [Buddleja alternifolia]|uniref:non-specific serine/threonine protein kinase n=1 Tax=Buddleja alternifolia TaxID=168488 RepID=A0AAV6XRV2_9LAMI|nr:hypothetical protein BUALT_Bualt03G0022900 [Buddleja alternifolia]
MVMASRSSGAGGSGSGNNVGRTRVGRYELGRTLGEGTFAKVKFARNVETGENVAIKILDKEKVLKHKMIGQIKREISTMKLIRHPNVIRMFEVMASKTKIYIVMEFVTGGELFDKIATKGRLKEDEARKYFQQLINAVDYCHSRGVYHRDLKPENLLLDANGVLKVSDFGLSALPQQVRVINNKGYDGAKADLWSCGVILFVLMAGYLPFEESNLMALYKKIFKADFSCPPWFSSSAKKLIKRILDPNPSTRITIAEVLENEWFKKGYKSPIFEHEEVTVDDVNSIFNELTDSSNLVVERREERPPTAPVTMNAFELISTSQGLNLSSLFEKQMGLVKRETRFTSKCPANEIISKIEQAAGPMGFDVKKNNYKMKLHGEKSGRKGPLSIATEIFEVAPSLHMVELRKAGGDTLEFHKFYKNLSTGLKDIVWKTGDEAKNEVNNGVNARSDKWKTLHDWKLSNKKTKTQTPTSSIPTPLDGGATTMPAAAALHSSMCFSSPKPAANSYQQSSNQLLTTKPKTLLHKHPLYQPTHANISFQFKEKILCLEIMGVDSGRALAQNPSLRTASLHSIHAIVVFLQSKGLHLKDLGRIFGMCPQILTSDIKTDLIPVFNFLSYDLKVSEQNFRKVINKCPRLLISSVRDQLKPALFYLRRLGFQDLHALAYQDPILLVSSVEKTLIPKLDYLVSLGFCKSDAMGMVRRCPGLFTFSVENNFKPKFDYFEKEMKGTLDELKEFPQYFAFSLENRIKPRHMEVVQSGVEVPLPLMLKTTDEEFRELLSRQESK